ncbi:MAG: alpha-E domain-containing protein [Lachnospiraceae bacterium]|nr:alpha-E domain-containing protein [Lachnospiraceae bacterium]
MAILSIEHSDRLFWLGRYCERVYTTIKEFAIRFDSMIELKDEDYNEYCIEQDIPNIYTSKEDFIKRYCFDETDTNSIFSNLIRAYDNAVVLREEIGSETLAYVQLAVYAMNKAKTSEAPLVYLQKVVDNIVAFWGMADDDIDSECVRSMLKLGKRVERIDLYARMKMEKAELQREMKRLSKRINRTGIRYSTMKLAHLNYIMEMDEIPTDLVVEEIESLFDVRVNEDVVGL